MTEAAVKKVEAKEADIRPAKDAKDEFKTLPESFKDSLNGLNQEQLKAKLAEIELAQQHNAASRSADPDIKSLNKKLSTAKAPYAQEAKELRLKAKYVIRSLSDSGETKAEEIIQLNLSAKGFSE